MKRMLAKNINDGSTVKLVANGKKYIINQGIDSVLLEDVNQKLVKVIDKNTTLYVEKNEEYVPY